MFVLLRYKRDLLKPFSPNVGGGGGGGQNLLCADLIVYDFSAGYGSIDKSDILNIHRYLMSNNYTKQCSVRLLYY